MITDQFSTVVPAYGRDYKNKKDAIDAFNSGKDFLLQRMLQSQALSKRDFAPGCTVNIRYNKLTKIAVVRIKD